MKRTDRGLPPIFDLFAYMFEDVRRDLAGNGILSCVVSRADESDLDPDDWDRLSTLPATRVDRSIMERRRLQTEARRWLDTADFVNTAEWCGADPVLLRESLLDACTN